MTPGKIKNIIWDKFTSSVPFKILFIVLLVVYFYCMSANRSLDCAFLLIFYLCIFECILCIVFLCAAIWRDKR